MSHRTSLSGCAKSDSSLLFLAVELMANGLVTIARINVLAFKVMTAPFRLAGRFF